MYMYIWSIPCIYYTNICTCSEQTYLNLTGVPQKHAFTNMYHGTTIVLTPPPPPNLAIVAFAPLPPLPRRKY